MPFDWSTVLDDQDQSLEGLLARRDMSKQMNQMLSVQRQSEEQRQNVQQEAARNKALVIQEEENKARMKQAESVAAALAQRTKVDDDRQRATQLRNTPPGTVFQQPEADFLTGQGFGGELTPNEGGGVIFRRQEAEKLANKLKLEEQHAAEQAKRQKESDAREVERLKMAKQDQADRQKKEADLAKSRDLARKAVQKRIDALDPMAQGAVRARAKELAEGQGFDISDPSTWLGPDGEMNATAAWDQAEREVRQSRRPNMPIGPEPPALPTQGAKPTAKKKVGRFEIIE